MVAKRQCTFCAQEIEPGTGTIFVKRDGTVYQFCSSSCRKQQLHLGRIGHRFKWTRAYALKKAAERSSAERGTGAPARSRTRAPTGSRPPPSAPAAAAASPGGASGPTPAAEPAAAPAASPKKPRVKPPAKPGANPAGKAPSAPPSADP